MRSSSLSLPKVLLGLCFVLLLLCASTLWAAPAEPIKVGVVVSVSGFGGFMGTPIKEAMTAIIEDFNKKGGLQGRQVELFFEDDQSIPSNAVVATTKLVRDEKVSALTGPSITDSAMAMIPIAELEQVPFAALGPVVNPFKKWVFNVTPNETVNAAAVLEYAVKDLGAKRIAVMHDVQNLGTMGWKTIQAEIPKYQGSTVVLSEGFEASDKSLVPQMMKVKAANPDVLLIETSGGESAGIIAKNYKQLGLKMPVVTCPAVGTREFLKIGAPSIEGSSWFILAGKVMIAEKLSPNDPYRQNVYDPFRKLMKEKYGESKNLTLFHYAAHDAIQVVLGALKLAGSDDRAAIRNGMEAFKFESLLGPYSCTPTDHRGVKIFNGLPSIVQNGEYVPYTKK